MAEHDVQHIVIGKSLRLDGSAIPAVEAFCDELRKSVKVSVELWDERLSMAQAERPMIEGGVRRVQRRQSIGQAAAMLIFRFY